MLFSRGIIVEHRQHLKDLIKTNSDGTKLCDDKAAFESVELVKTLLESQNRFSNAYSNLTLYDGVRWIFGYSNYINQNLLKERSKLPLHHKYSTGSIVYVDFFGHFGNEMAFDHPAIVLGEVGRDLIVAPITSNESVFGDSEYYHVKLEKGIAALGDMPVDSTIKLEQVRFISKRRLLVNFKKRISDNGKLEEIDIALMKILASYTFEKREKRYEELVKLAQHAEEIIQESLEYVDELTKKNEKLEEEIEALKKQQVV